MSFMSLKNNSRRISATMILAGAFVSNSVFADDHKKIDGYMDNCQNLPLVSSILNGKPNTNVCVDAPVALKKVKAVFDMNSDALDGQNRHTGLRHMMMMGTALKARINAGLVDPEDVRIIGVLHGSGVNLAVSEAMSPVTKGLIESIYALKNAGVNISLEVCGVTMHGKGLTNADLYSSPNGTLHVNQGAIGRIIDLEQHKYALIKE